MILNEVFMFAPEKKTKEIDFDIFSKDKKDYQLSLIHI